jgi:O-antigen/teichoic acid export membrane protein
LTKKFTQSLFILLFLNLLVKPFWIFGIDRTIQNRVGAEEYGLYFSLFGFSLLLNMISDLGITNFNNRYIAQNNNQLGKLLGLIIPVKLILSITYCLVTLVIALFLGYTNRQFGLLIWLIINQALASLILYLRSNISALQLFNTDSIISVIDKLITIILCSLLLWGNFNLTFRIEWLIYMQTIAYIVTLIIVLSIVLKKSGRLSFGLNFITLKNTLKMSFPFALLAILMIVYNRIDAVMLERMLPDGQTQAGIYAQAFRICDALSMFAVLFASILLPLFAKMLNENEPIRATLSHSFALLMIPTMAAIAPLILSSGEFMNILYHHHSEESAKVLSILLVGFCGICLNYLFGTLLTASGKLKILNQLALMGVIVNVLLNLILIPRLGAMGAAITSASTQLLLGICLAIIAIRAMDIKVKTTTPIKYGGVIISSVLFTYLLKMIIPWYFTIFLLPVLTVIFGMLLKLIKIENLRNTFKKDLN